MARDAIVVQDVSKVFLSETSATTAIKQINLSVESGQFVTIIGPSGCGKTTLLRLIGALLNPTEGQIFINGKTPKQARIDREFGWVFQDPTLFPWRNVIQNIQLPGEIFGEVDVKNKSSQLIELVGLSGFEYALPKELSGGMRSRVAIARALSLRPSMLLMDEPFGSLDELTRDRMQLELMRIHREAKNTVVFVTHSIQEAAFLADKVIVMTSQPGRIRREVNVAFPHPRSFQLRKDKMFVDLVECLRRDLET